MSGSNEGVWEGLDVPYIRSLAIDSLVIDKLNYAPIDNFGSVYLHSDAWHTDARGYKLIAEDLVRNIESLPSFKKFISNKYN